MKYLEIKSEDYGDLLPYIEDENITDINWNGNTLWLDDLEKGRYKVDTKLTKEFIDVFSKKIANSMNVNFNKFKPLLEAETDDLRISILHETVTNTGFSISIRKTPAKRRISKNKAIQDGYCTLEVDTFLHNCIKAGLSVIVVGIPGTGKTEYVKYLTQYIPKNERAITIEDNLELRYSIINPYSDVLEIKVDDEFNYQNAIKCSLRQRPDWILLSEARSREVAYLLESASTGTGCITTMHTDTVRKIPDRIINMIGDSGREKEDNIYSFFNVGVLITRKVTDDKITRMIAEVCIFDREDGVNKIQMIYENGKLLTKNMPLNFKTKFIAKNIKNPFEVAK